MGYLRHTAGATRYFGGLWKYLAARASGRTAIELERERNRATAAAIQLLPAGAEMMEYEREGRFRVIRMPKAGDPPPVVITDIRSRTNGELHQ